MLRADVAEFGKQHVFIIFRIFRNSSSPSPQSAHLFGEYLDFNQDKVPIISVMFRFLFFHFAPTKPASEDQGPQ